MRFRGPKRLRIISGASLMLLLVSMPVLIGLTRLAPDPQGEPPGLLATYATGLSSMGLAGLVSAVLAIVFGIWLLMSSRREVGRKYLLPSSRRRRNLVEDARTVAIILGATGLIVGSLAGLYAAMLHARPDLYDRLSLPFLTAELALGSLLGGGLLYAAGRIGR